MTSSHIPVDRGRNRISIWPFIIGIPFMLIGAIMAYLIFMEVSQNIEMRGWHEVPATLESVELATYDHGDSKTYEVKASYQYEFGGKSYTGTKASQYLSDNIGEYHQDLYNRLKEKFDLGETVSAFVNPNDPEQAFLDRTLRYGSLILYLIFLIVFGGFGLGAVLLASNSAKKTAERKRLLAEHPDEPWFHRQDWKQGRIVSEQRAFALVLLFMAVIWNAISIPATVLAVPEVIEGNYTALLVLLFTVVGLLLAWGAVVSVRRWRRFGKATLELLTVPAVPGESLRGRIHTGAGIIGVPTMEVVLTCYKYERVRHQDRGTSLRTSKPWSTKINVPIRPGGGYGSSGSTVDIEFPLPEDALATLELLGPGISYGWTVEAYVKLSGADFNASFEVPVYRKRVNAMATAVAG